MREVFLILWVLPAVSGTLTAHDSHFLGADAGSANGLPDAKHAYADSRTQSAIELMVRLLRERHAYEINFVPESSLLVSAELFPSFYALVGDRTPKAPPKMKAQGARSPRWR